MYSVRENGVAEQQLVNLLENYRTMCPLYEKSTISIKARESRKYVNMTRTSGH